MARPVYDLEEAPVYVEPVEKLLNTDSVVAEGSYFEKLVLRILKNIKAVKQEADATTMLAEDSIPKNEKGAPRGVATLGEDMKLAQRMDYTHLDGVPGALPAQGGNADTAVRLKTARNISLSGGVTGVATKFDGSGDIVIPVTGINVANANAGTLAIARGGTGGTSPANARANLGVAYGTTAGTVCQGNDMRLSNARTPTAHNQGAGTITPGTFPGAVTANSNTAYTTRQVRNIVMSAATGTATQNGDVYHVYK